jgi:hypothetical protein
MTLYGASGIADAADEHKGMEVDDVAASPFKWVFYV